ncbi:MAG: ATP-binding cassette domain-containing protein [Lachnospiraceae bacterium]|nr:ATP-binding cassette domain-containing protein [Lachnospiraceae bacterium]
MDYCLATNALSKYYKDFKALNSLSMHVPKGAIYGFVGKNGAGKTTLIRLICGLQLPTSGEFTLYGVGNTDKRIDRCRRRMGAVVETPSVYMDTTARENIKEQYRVLGMPSFDGVDELLAFVGLENTGKKKVRNFSLGMRQRLGIAIALCGEPDFLMLDEPINGLDPQGIIEMRELILRLNREKQITVLISSHILDELSRLASYYGFIDKGSMVKEISAAELEAECRKCTRVTVNDTKLLCMVLDKIGLEYKVVSATEADIYGAVKAADLVHALDEAGCETMSMHEKNESLETYYMNLVGGASDD